MLLAFELVLPLLLAASQAVIEPEPAQGPVTRQAVSRDTPLLDFDYVWPEAVSADPALSARMNDDSAKTYDEALKNARENKADTEKVGAPFNQNLFARTWTLEGQTARFMSLVAGTDTFAGGAHPNHTSSAILWDRSLHRDTQLAELFTSAGALETAVGPRFCKSLDAERLKRRQSEVLDGEFSQCPAFATLTIAPADDNGDGRFESIQLTADPYVAGPYVEGSYEIMVAVDALLISQLKPELRGDFQVQPAQ